MRAESTRFSSRGSVPTRQTSRAILPYRHYTAKAIAVCNADDSVDYEPYFPGSKADFVQALLILSTNLPKPRSIFGLGDIDIEAVEVAHLRCPFETWLAVFWCAENVEEHEESAPMFPVHVWHYRCEDGPISCVGYQVDDLYGTRWVTFVRLRLPCGPHFGVKEDKHARVQGPPRRIKRYRRRSRRHDSGNHKQPDSPGDQCLKGCPCAPCGTGRGCVGGCLMDPAPRTFLGGRRV